MADIGNSNRIAREYIDSLRIETRYMDAAFPATDFELYGEQFDSPIMTAALSHLDHFMFEGAAEALARGAAAANAVLWYGMAEDDEIARLADTGARMIEIIKPYADRERVFDKIAAAEKLGLLAVGIDIDHPFSDDGGPDVVDGQPMAPLRTDELAQFVRETRLPVIVKGVLSRRDAERCLAAGARGLVLSHHNNRIEYAVPPLAVLPEIAALAGDTPLFVDCEIRTGMDAFKALALGAKGVCIGRPLMTAIRENTETGAGDYLKHLTGEILPAAEAELGFSPAHRGVVGYSLGGLFALYAYYESACFDLAASVSGSMWYDGWLDYMRSHTPPVPGRVHLSVGDREKKSRNERMKTVEDATREAAEILKSEGVETAFVLNPGNHFQDPSARQQKALNWLLAPYQT